MNDASNGSSKPLLTPYMKAFLIYFSLFTALLPYSIIAYMIYKNMTPQTSDAFSQEPFSRTALYIMILLPALFSRMISKKFSSLKLELMASGQFRNTPFMSVLIGTILSESSALIGFVCFVIVRDITYFIIGVVIASIGFAMNFPNAKDWEEKLP